MPNAARNEAGPMRATRCNRIGLTMSLALTAAITFGPAIAFSATSGAPSAQAAPAANTSVGNARVLVPDGTSVSQPIGALETRWFVFQVEAGRSYVVEAVDSNGDLSADAVGAISITDATGLAVPIDTVADCTLTLRDQAPGLSPTNNGRRCSVHVAAPDQATTNRKDVYVSVAQGTGSGVNVRVRDATLFGRWTTNGYEFHIEFDNTTADPVCAQALLYRESGYAFSAGWGNAAGNLGRYQLLIPPNGSIKTVVPDGLAVGGTNRGTLRIVGCPASDSNFVPGAVHVSTYAFNPVTHVYLFFYNWQSHNGSGANSW